MGESFLPAAPLQCIRTPSAGLIMGIIGVTLWVIGVTNLLTESP